MLQFGLQKQWKMCLQIRYVTVFSDEESVNNETINVLQQTLHHVTSEDYVNIDQHVKTEVELENIEEFVSHHIQENKTKSDGGNDESKNDEVVYNTVINGENHPSKIIHTQLFENLLIT